MSKPCEVFVSYSRHDQDRVKVWVNRLREGGIEVFFDTESLVGGSEWRDDIVDAIREAKVVIFVASERAFASDYVPKELALAEQAKKYILPIFLDKTEPSKKAAFILADLHRISAAGKTDDEIWGAITRALVNAGVKCPEPETKKSVFLSEDENSKKRKRDDRWLEWDASNPKIESDDQAQNLPRTKWSKKALITGAAMFACVPFVFLAKIASEKGSERNDQPIQKRLPETPVVIKAVPLTEKKPPVEMPKSLREEAILLTHQYYATPDAGEITQQVSLLADPLEDYFDAKQAPLSQIKDELTAYSLIWPTQHFEVVGPISTTESTDGDSVECVARIKFSSENDVARQSGSFQGKLKVKRVDGIAKIVAVNQVHQSRVSAEPVFKREGQGVRAIEFVRKAALSGNSDAGMSAEEVAEMFVPMPDHYGQVATHEEIAKQTRSLHDRFKKRTFKMLEGPVVMNGLETPQVTVRVKMEFKAYKGDDPKPASGGTVTSVYVLTFSSAGTPLIASVEEIDRTPLADE